MTTDLLDRAAPRNRSLLLDDADDVQEAAAALAAGGAVGQAFGNFYVLTTRPDAATVRRINLLKGRPPNQVGSVVTTPLRIPLLFNWSALPDGLTPRAVRSVVDALFELGPFGFRGPAAAHVPDHLAQVDGGIRTTQVIAPGYACPSNRFLSRALDLVGDDLLYVTSANRSRHLTGAPTSRRTGGPTGCARSSAPTRSSSCSRTPTRPRPVGAIRCMRPCRQRSSRSTRSPAAGATCGWSSNGTGRCLSRTSAR